MLRIFISLIFLPMLAWAHPIAELEQAYLNKDKNYTPRTQHLDKQGRAIFSNHLILESSPYLLQHAHNPVNWYAFSDEAFDRAKKENKPVFISIGYATCHWCHVMEEESFDDIEVAQYLNQHFIAIKVDREIRPDIDAVYMNVAQSLNGYGGWPLNALLLPNGKAFFAGTYFPKTQLLDVLSQMANLWKNKQEKVINQANKIDNILNKTATKTSNTINKDISTQAIQAMLASFDDLEGGFGDAPKFPHESMLLLLLDEHKRRPNIKQLNAIKTTLDAMASGGLYDVVGGGFHRYSTDNAWLIPHFEKMLYNQAQLSLVYTRAYQITQKPLYKRIAKHTLDYVLREMQGLNGGFFSATDADSEGEEGTFFVWSIKELKETFSEDEFNAFDKWFDLSAHTDFEGDHIIRFKDIDSIKQSKFSQIDQLLNQLYKVRSKRILPLTDHKVLLSWNALMIPSLLEAGKIFNEDKYTKASIKLAQYLHSHFNHNGQLYRVSTHNQPDTKALFEDYSYLANAYLSAYDHTNNNLWLNRTIQLVEIMNRQFWDTEQFGFNLTNANKYINANHKESFDGAIPSANAIAYNVLIKLNNRTAHKEYGVQAEQLLNVFADEINQDPTNHSSFVLGFNNKTRGEIANTTYAYNGRIHIDTQKNKHDQVAIKLTLAPLWHINSHQPLQKSLIATKVVSKDEKNWTIKHVNYPRGELAELGFSKEKISVYKDQVTIKIDLINHSNVYVLPTLDLTLQACSDTVCLPPTTVTLKP